MKPEPSESFQNLKITQVELPPNLYVYGQPVNLHPAYQYDPSNVKNAHSFLPVVELNKPVDPMVKEDAQVKTDLRRSGACFYYVLCVLAFLSILGIIRTVGLIKMVVEDDTVPRVAIGFIVCNLIEDLLNISSVFPAKEGIYAYNFDRMILCRKIIFGGLLFFIISNICFIIYARNYDNRTLFDNIFLGINLAVGILVYLCLIVNCRTLLRLLVRIKQIQENMAARAHINI